MLILRPVAAALAAAAALALFATPLPAGAGEAPGLDLNAAGAIAAHWPAGSIDTPEKARQALKDAAGLREQLHDAALAGHLACKDGTIFMDYCRGRVKAAADAREAEIAAIESQAKTVLAAQTPASRPAAPAQGMTLSEKIRSKMEAMRAELPSALSDDSITGRWPAGSIDTHEKAQAALDDADRARKALEKAADAGHDICIGRVLVSGCWEDVRRAKYMRGQEIRRVELEAKDFMRAENAAKEKRRQLAARIEEGKAVSDEQAKAAGMTPAEVDEARARGRERQADEAAAEQAAGQRKADLKNRLEQAEERKAAAAERVEQGRQAAEQAARRNAEAARRAAQDGEYEAAAARRLAEARQREAEAKQRSAESARRRAERRARSEEQRKERLEAQKRYESEKARREKSLNPFD